MGFLFFSRVGKSIATFSLFDSSPREILATVGTFDGCIREEFTQISLSRYSKYHSTGDEGFSFRFSILLLFVFLYCLLAANQQQRPPNSSNADQQATAAAAQYLVRTVVVP